MSLKNKGKGWGLRIVQDFINNHSHIDKYSMKEITECIGDIGRANSLDLTGLDIWILANETEWWLTKFDSFHNSGQRTICLGHLTDGTPRVPASFQRLMEKVLLNIKNVLVYIDNLLIHTANHEDHLKVLEKVFERLHQNHLKVNLEKCVFGNQEVSYLGFTLTSQGINQVKTSYKLLRMHNLQPISKW